MPLDVAAHLDKSMRMHAEVRKTVERSRAMRKLWGVVRDTHRIMRREAARRDGIGEVFSEALRVRNEALHVLREISPDQS